MDKEAQEDQLEFYAYEVINDDGQISIQIYNELHGDEKIIGVLKLKFSEELEYTKGKDSEICRVGEIVSVNGFSHKRSEVIERIL